MKTLEELFVEMGFGKIYSALATLFSYLTFGNIIAEIKKLNKETTDRIAVMRASTKTALQPIVAKLQNIVAATIALKDVDKDIERLRAKYGFRNSDMKVVECVFILAKAVLASLILIVLIEFLLSGTVIFPANQAAWVKYLLMLCAICSALAWSWAAAPFAIRRRIKMEVNEANRNIIADKKANTSHDFLTDVKNKKPESYLPIWLQPSKKHVPMNEANVFLVEVDGKPWGIEGSIYLWKVKKSMVMPVGAIILGFVFMVARFAPIYMQPKLYGPHAMKDMALITGLILFINCVVFAVEYYRRRSGLIDDLQIQINEVVRKRKTLLKKIGGDEGVQSLKAIIKNTLQKVQSDLDSLYEKYSKSFADFVATAMNSDFGSNLSAYLDAYEGYKTEIDAFILATSSYPEATSTINENMPSPEVVKNMKAPTEDSLNEYKLSEDLFTFKEEDFFTEEKVVAEEVAEETTNNEGGNK